MPLENEPVLYKGKTYYEGDPLPEDLTKAIAQSKMEPSVNPVADKEPPPVLEESAIFPEARAVDEVPTEPVTKEPAAAVKKTGSTKEAN